MTTNDFPPQLVLQQMIQGFQVTQCIYVAATLGIADLLKDGPCTSEDLAQVTDTHDSSLYRVLRLLTAIGLLTEGEAHSFALTPLGAYLQTNVPGSMHDTVLCYCDTPVWHAWGTSCTAQKQAIQAISLSWGSPCLTTISSTPSMPLVLTI